MRIFEYRGKSVASSKNNKRICNGRIINSARTMEYYDWVIPLLERDKADMILEIGGKYPTHIHIIYYFKDKRRRDLSNMIQVIADALLKVDIIPDDDYKHFWPVFEEVHIDKENPGIGFWFD